MTAFRDNSGRICRGVVLRVPGTSGSVPGVPGCIPMGVDVRSTSPSRRALGLLAVSTLGMSTAVLAATGVAQAALTEYTFSTMPGPDVDEVVSTYLVVDPGYCSIEWKLVGGTGGHSLDMEPGEPGTELRATTPLYGPETFNFVLGGNGGDVDSGPGSGGANGGEPGTEDPQNSDIGGGGGGATEVTPYGSSFLTAPGGRGGGTTGGPGGGVVEYPFDATDVLQQPASSGPEISGTVQPCVAPGVPSFEENIGAGDGQLAIQWHAPIGGEVPAETYEYRLNGGAWTTITDVHTVDGRLSTTLTDLTNGTDYTIELRAVSAEGVAGEASIERTATPFKAAGAPTDVAVTTGPSSLTVTWGAAPSGGPPISAYKVELPWSRGESGGATLFCETDAAGRSCTAKVAPGTAHDVVVYAVDAQGHQGEWARATSGVVPVSATVPTSNGDLTAAAGSTDSVTPGKKVTVTGTGYLPNSTVTLLVYSEPQVLTTVVTDNTGSFTVEVTVPAGLPEGHHTLVASGVDASGAAYSTTLPITVVGGTTGAGGLAYTGADIALPMTGGLAALVVGTGLLVVSRRRRATA